MFLNVTPCMYHHVNILRKHIIFFLKYYFSTGDNKTVSDDDPDLSDPSNQQTHTLVNA